jgi:tripartite-type tricarboxylate transporter receptor subunit TctC
MTSNSWDRRRILRSAASAAAGCLAAPAIVRAQATWPARPVKILISFPPGVSSDIIARALSPHLSEMFGQQFVVDNKPGAGGTVAADALKRENPDGHAFLLSNNAPFTFAPIVFKKVPYDPVKDFTHVAYLGSAYGGLTSHPKAGLKSLPDLVTKAKAAPGKFTYGSSGVGSIGHITGSAFCKMAGIDMVHIPYRGAAPMRVDLTAGVVDMSFEGLDSRLPEIEAGTMTGLASCSEKRLAKAPSIPTFRELGFDLISGNWHGMSAPAGLAPAVAEKLHAGLTEICKREAVLKQMDAIGNVYDQMTREQFSTFVTDQLTVWRPMIMAAGVVEQ